MATGNELRFKDQVLYAERVLVNGTDIAGTEVAYVDGLTPGEVLASKALVVNSDRDLGVAAATAVRNLLVTNLDAGISGTAGTVDIFPTTASKGKLSISCTDQTGDTTVSLVAGAMATARTITIPDPGAAASVLMSTGTATATDATSAELTRACDMSARVVDLAVSTAITEVAHEGRTVVMGGAGSARTFTLPVPVAGMKFKFVVGAVNTSNYLIKSVAGTQTMKGTLMFLSDNAAAAVIGFTAGATDDTITLNGTTTGGVAVGDWIELEALSATVWAVRGQLTASGTEATPFSDTVA